MEFLTLIIVLGLLQYWGSGGPVQKDHWFSAVCQRFNTLLPSARLRLLMMVGLPAVVVLVAQSLLSSVLFGLLSLVLYVYILLYSLGRGDVTEYLQRYLSAWNHGNFESAYEKAMAIGDFEQTDAIADHQSLHEHLRRAYLYEGFERWFAVVFWFLLLGPVGAIAYRLSYLCGRSNDLEKKERQLALRFVHYLDWVPVRLLALSFSLTGNFVNVFGQCTDYLMDNQPSSELLEQCALHAISDANDERVHPTDSQNSIEYGRDELLALQSLLSRSVVCWLVIIAVVTLVSG